MDIPGADYLKKMVAELERLAKERIAKVQAPEFERQVDLAKTENQLNKFGVSLHNDVGLDKDK